MIYVCDFKKCSAIQEYILNEKGLKNWACNLWKRKNHVDFNMNWLVIRSDPNLGPKNFSVSHLLWFYFYLLLSTSLFTNRWKVKWSNYSKLKISTGNQISSLRILQKKTCETQSKSPMSSFQRLLLMVSHVWGVQEQRSRYAKGTCCSNKLLL